MRLVARRKLHVVRDRVEELFVPRSLGELRASQKVALRGVDVTEVLVRVPAIVVVGRAIRIVCDRSVEILDGSFTIVQEEPNVPTHVQELHGIGTRGERGVERIERLAELRLVTAREREHARAVERKKRVGHFGTRRGTRHFGERRFSTVLRDGS
jgi:hypothetical protein